MGMYTQAKGMLNVDSIGNDEEYYEICRNLAKAKKDFEDMKTVDRTWVCDCTHAHLASNGSVFIFFGAELKNYSNEIDSWINHLLPYFPNAEGKFDVQYEESEFPTTYFVYKGKIVKRQVCSVGQYGYGNSVKW